MKTIKYFDYQCPEPQYLGAKHMHLAWWTEFIPNNLQSAIDAFAGSQSVAYLFKQIGYNTIKNDILNFNNQIGIALMENKDTSINSDDFKILFHKSTFI